MPNYQARYTCSGELQSSVVDFITRNAQKYIIAKEIATREHIQCYVETEITKKTWDNKFRLKFPEMDRRDKYFKEDKGLTKFYVCKENCILAKRGFSDEDIESFRTEYHQTHPKEEISLKIEEILVSQPETKPEKVKKPRPPTFMTQCRNELEEDYPFMDWSAKHKKLVFLKVMNKLGEGCKNLDHIIITRMVYGVLNSLIKDKKEWHEYWYNKCFGEEFLIVTSHDNTDLDKEDYHGETYDEYIKRVQKENAEEEARIINALTKPFLSQK